MRGGVLASGGSVRALGVGVAALGTARAARPLVALRAFCTRFPEPVTHLEGLPDCPHDSHRLVLRMQPLGQAR